MNTEPLTEAQRQEILTRAGYNPDDETTTTTPTEAPPEPTPKRKRAKKTVIADGVGEARQVAPAPDPNVATATSPLRDNDWQNAEFQRLKATPNMRMTPEEMKEHNRKLWQALANDRSEWNKQVRAAQRALSNTGQMREVIKAERDQREQTIELADLLKDFTPHQIADALKMRDKS